MLDAVYVIATLCFFALMLVFVKLCNRLGMSADVEHAREERS